MSAAPTERQSAPLSLRDGQRVMLREAQRDDERAIGEFLDGLGLEARWFRFFSGAVDLARTTRSLTRTASDRIGMLALDEAGTVVGHAVCIEVAPGRAEVALEVADRLHGNGLGTLLVERLAELAEARGITMFEAQVLPENRAMLDVFRDGFDARVKWANGVEAVEFPTSAWRLARRRYGEMFGDGPAAD